MLSCSGSISMRADSLSKRSCQRSAEPSHRGTGCGVMMSSLSKPPRSNKTFYENLFCQYKCKKATSICLHNQRSRAFNVCSLHESTLLSWSFISNKPERKACSSELSIFLEVYSQSLLICVYSTKRICLQKGAAPSQGLQNGMLEPGHDPHPFQKYCIPPPSQTQSASAKAQLPLPQEQPHPSSHLLEPQMPTREVGSGSASAWWTKRTYMIFRVTVGHWEHLQYVI